MPVASLRKLLRRDSRETVETLRAKALALIGEGKTIMEVQSRGGSMSQKAFPMKPDDVVAECNWRLDRLDGFGKRKSYAWMAGNP